MTQTFCIGMESLNEIGIGFGDFVSRIIFLKNGAGWIQSNDAFQTSTEGFAKHAANLGSKTVSCNIE